jgi:glyoxylase-like metal-dependent hydrolase (beta-lactamase superfamily II)
MAGYSRGLEEVGDGLFAYLQPDGGWGWSNAGLVADSGQTLLIDTLFDLKLTEQMLSDMRRAVPAASRIDTLVNTHANGDHCYGNQLVGDARIVASERTAAEMAELPATAMAALVREAPNMGELGEFFLRCFGAFDFDGIEMVLPDESFSGELTLHVGSREVRLIEVGPAHTMGDTLALLPVDRVLFSGDILFNRAHPIAWAGPISNWIKACDRILAMDLEVIVPGHGPLADQADVRELKAYFEYLYEQARACHAAGMSSLEAAQSIVLDRWADWR